MSEFFRMDRRNFIKQASGALGIAAQAAHWSTPAAAEAAAPFEAPAQASSSVEFPRTFRGRQLQMIAFPLGGVAAGSIALGGRGQLRDWEIFNRPNKGYRPDYCMPSIWVQSGNAEPVARVLEARILTPYEGESGLGAENAPGLIRLDSATFTGAYPFAHVDFHDEALPVHAELEAFSPFIPHDPEDSGLPVAVLRYRVTNSQRLPAKVSIGFSLENPVKGSSPDARVNQFCRTAGLAGLLMNNSALAATDPMMGSVVLAALPATGAEVSHWEGWPRARWWASPLLYWDRFSKFGNLGDQPTARNAVGALCVQRTIEPGQSADFTFLIAWNFPNRTPEWCSWEAPPGEGKTIIGNHYTTRFKDAWEAAEYTAANFARLEQRTRLFADAFRHSSVPGPLLEAASANLSTLATTTCFRTADGEFHGFEGSGGTWGCCFGNCTHVWNYETVTPFLFPSFARSLRRSAFGYCMDDDGAIHFRQLLPAGKKRSGLAAADGQMGQILHAWLDWKLSGDTAWLRSLWPRIRKAVEFAWVSGGWDANRDGVLEGVQHNTYDVEFYGPNPLCGIYYLGALRAAEEMASAVGDSTAAREYRRLFTDGSRWIDNNLFNGEYYIQQIRSIPREKIAPTTRGEMGAEDSEHPQFQVGAGCLVDQLMGQYLADVGTLGPLVSPDNIRKAVAAIHRYNFKSSLEKHENVARTYALNDEAAVVVCDYGAVARPEIPFPYFSEAWTGLEYTIASLLINWGMALEGVECVRTTRSRYDGERRNPWDEAECGHHYARAMSAWSTFIAASGFKYEGDVRKVHIRPRIETNPFQSFWSTATGWGTYTLNQSQGRSVLVVRCLSGTLPCAECAFPATGANVSARLNGSPLDSAVEQVNDQVHIALHRPVEVSAGGELQFEVSA